MKHIILMADIVRSRTLNQSALMTSFKAVVAATNKQFKNVLLSPLTITLGDEFQGIVKNVAAATNVILFLEEQFIHQQLDFKLRYVLNEGEIETPINPVIAYEMLGEGLTMARIRLNKLKQNDQRFSFSLQNNLLSELLSQCFIIFSSIIDKWSVEKDYELVANFLDHKDYKKIATLLNKNRSLLWKREKSLNLEAYYAIKKVIETTSLQTTI